MGRVLLLEPRRVAARAARRMVAEHGSTLGDTFGYHVRFERQFGHSLGASSHFN